MGCWQALDITISEALSQQIATEKANQDLVALISNKDELLKASQEEKADVERQYGSLAQSKERLEIELSQAVKTAENFELRAASLTSEIQAIKARVLVKNSMSCPIDFFSRSCALSTDLDNFIGQKALADKEGTLVERDLLIESLRSRCRDFEENLSCSVLNLQEKESQNLSLSSSLVESRVYLEQQVQAANSEMQRVKEMLMFKEQQMECCEAEFVELVDKCRRMETQVHNLSEILIESQQRWEMEIEQEKDRHTVLESRCSEAESELRKARDLVEVSENECELARVRARELEHALAVASGKEESLVQQIKVMEEKLSRLESVEKHQLPQMIAKCKSLEVHTHQLSDILVESQGRWEKDIATANVKLNLLETKLSEAQKSARLSDAAARESGKVTQTLSAKISELEQLVNFSTEEQASNQRQIQEQEDHITKLLVIEKKRLDTINTQRAALKAAEESSLLLKKEIRDLKSHLALAEARDASLWSNIDQLKVIGQEKESETRISLQKEIKCLREEMNSGALRIEHLIHENSLLKAEVCGLKQERAPWPNAITGYSSKADRRKTTMMSLGFGGEAENLRIQLEAVEKLAAERTEQVTSLREVSIFEILAIDWL